MAIDMQKRRAVMSRSIRLGHCVCNAKQPCPCDKYRNYNVCPCAGEKMPVQGGAEVLLTRHVKKAGCASKISQADLLRILGNLPKTTDPNVLVGTEAGDDAGVYRISDHLALVQTVDVFTPCVDDAHLFGQIAAANSVSDVYAMGGTPITALSVAAFPIEELDGSVLEAMLRGAMEKLQEAHCSLIGGHSINDEEIKLGFAVTGVMDPEKTVCRGTAQAGDVLVLTKPLGTGMVSFAAQIGRARPEALAEAGKSMATLNRDAAELMVRYGAHAATDITGFGLAGHLVEMCRGSGVSAEIDFRTLPVFRMVPDCIAGGVMSGGIERNQEYAMAWVRADDPAVEPNLPILYDPQTSGGMLVALAPPAAETFVAVMRERGHAATSVIGRIVERTTAESRIVVTHGTFENLHGCEGGLL